MSRRRSPKWVHRNAPLLAADPGAESRPSVLGRIAGSGPRCASGKDWRSTRSASDG